MATGKLEPDGYMMDFYPMDYKLDYDSSTLRYMKMKSVNDPSRKSQFEVRVKQWLRGYVEKNHPNEAVLLVITPGHKAYDNSSFMYSLVREFITENGELNIEDGCNLLERYKTIEKQATAKGTRSESTHRESIRINVSETDEKKKARLNEGKVVLILDDVWTSGCTLRVCEEKLRTTGPKDVHLLAIGKTVQQM